LKSAAMKSGVFRRRSSTVSRARDVQLHCPAGQNFFLKLKHFECKHRVCILISADNIAEAKSGISSSTRYISE